MNPNDLTPKEHLLLALAFYEIPVLEDKGQVVDVAHGYRIEVERGFLFRLSQQGKVIAPFDDLDDLCRFIQLG